MRTRFLTILILLSSLLVITGYGIGGATLRPSLAGAQVQVGRGLIRVPALGQVLEASVPVALNWTLDNPADVESLNLILSTDGGLSFTTMIAGHLPPRQQQLIWSPGFYNATASARLKLVLNLVSKAKAEIVSDGFSILPAPRNSRLAVLARKQVMEGSVTSGEVGPAFANPGPCVGATLPTLNYNMDITNITCTTYGIEPSLAQDPTDPSHFHAVSGFGADTNITGGNWQFTGTAVTDQLNFSPYFGRGDMTTAIGLDGTVYVVSMATTFSGGPTDSIVVFRSKMPNSGVTFEPVVRIPGLSVSTIDKPVVVADPGNADILAITFIETSPGYAIRLAICNTATTNLSNWTFTLPAKSSFPGDYLDVVNSTHPVIDPISTGSTAYWLFVAQPNASLSNGTGGAKVYKYQLNNTDPASALGAPIQTPPGSLSAGEVSVGYPLWTTNSNGCTHIEETLRVSENCGRGRSNLTRAAIDYCDTTAHRMYIPVMANTLGSGLGNQLTSDLFVIVWQYTGTADPSCPTGICTARILPTEYHKYAACAATDGHGRVWVNCYAVTSALNSVNQNLDYQTAQMGAFAIDRITGAAGAIAYISFRLPQSFTPGADINKFGDYVYTEATYYPSSGGSRIASPTYTDFLCNAGTPSNPDLHTPLHIGISGWQ